MTTLEELRSLKSRSAFFSLPSSGLFSVGGTDAVRYLHNRLTQDIKNLAPGQATHAFALTPQGKVEADLLILRRADGLLIKSEGAPDKDAAEDERILSALFRFRVADQVQADPLRSSHRVFFVTGADARVVVETALQSTAPSAPLSFAESPEADSWLCLACPLFGMDGFLVIARNERAQAFEKKVAQAHTPPFPGSRETLEAMRVLGRAPLYGIDSDEKTTVSDLPLSHHVSFSKGCYAGQEVVEMSTARGRPNRRFVLLEGESSADIPPGTELFTPESGQRAAGVITSRFFVSELSRIFALGFLKQEVSAESTVVTASGQELRESSPHEAIQL